MDLDKFTKLTGTKSKNTAPTAHIKGWKVDNQYKAHILSFLPGIWLQKWKQYGHQISATEFRHRRYDILKALEDEKKFEMV